LSRYNAVYNINSYDDYQKEVFGREYLAAIHKRIATLLIATILFCGDSTTYGVGVDSDYKLDQLMVSFANNQSPPIGNITTINNGHSGATCAEWISLGYLTADIAVSPDLMIIRYGLNDGNTDTPAQLEANLRTALTTIRASLPLESTSIILMTPNACNSGLRNDTWLKGINAAYKRAARDFCCCFIDTYALFKDVENAGGWMDTQVDGSHIHPLNVMNIWISDIICNVAFPRMLVAKSGSMLPVWVVPTLQNGWTSFNISTHSQEGYYKDAAGVVHLKGLIKGGSTAASSVIFNLPAGHRPAKILFCPICAYSLFGSIQILPNGNVIVDNIPNNTYVSLEGVSFLVGA
jgi:lysophospholipase L1-like esterase